MKTDTELLENANFFLARIKWAIARIDAIWRKETSVNEKVRESLQVIINLDEDLSRAKIIFKSWETDLIKIKEEIEKLSENSKHDLQKDPNMASIFSGIVTLGFEEATNKTRVHVLLSNLIQYVESWSWEG